MNEAPDAVVQGLQARLGADRVLVDPGTLAGRARDTWPLRLVQAVAGAADPPPRCVALAHGGTICHHHGIGKLRAPWVPAELGSSYVLLERLKAALTTGWPPPMRHPG